ncbi:MFS transporter [Paenarthrobacter sp. YJN-5]|uniref:MFS transporter n=2 Tax=unclassified Paenarthrobacter TaxID=2634190 RepID=UPI001D0C6877|nr:MFS transporter [Paenarthrobacter sp. YJN-5]
MSNIDPQLSKSAGTASPPGRMAVGHAFRDMPFGSIHVKIGAILFIAWAIEAWEMLILTYVAGDLATSLQIGPTQVGIAISALFLGMIPGSLLWGPIADRIGRKATCAWSFAGYGVITLLSSFAPNFETLTVARFLSGLVFSGLFTITFPYFEELLPVKSRGKASVYLAAGWPIGILAALGTSALVGGHGWRWVIAASALASLWGIVLYKVVPESPYWLARKGRNEAAHQVLQRLGARGISRDTIFTSAEGKTGSIWSLFKGKLGIITVIQILINFTFSWGYWGLQTWMPTLLQDRGLSASSSLSFIALSAVMMIPGYITASYLTGRFGRKWIFNIYVLAAGGGGAYFATASTETEMYIGMFVLAFFSLGAWGVWDTWMGELYPSATRGSGFGLGIFGQRVANTIAPSLVGFLLASTTGATSTILFINMFLFITVILGLFLPETEGRELE